ncbi:MAG: hypothetical protein HY718_07850 [Planctomycetes bacterium]|nr:hypothetical protein [Planctomycetota bacterium]
MARKRNTIIPPSLPQPPPETEILEPEWFAAMSIYWESRHAEQAAEVGRLLGLAMREPTPERSICQLQQGLRELGLPEVLITKLILTRYLHHIKADTRQPAHAIAAEVLATLGEIHSSGRRRRGRERPRPRPASAAPA